MPKDANDHDESKSAKAGSSKEKKARIAGKDGDPATGHETENKEERRNSFSIKSKKKKEDHTNLLMAMGAAAASKTDRRSSADVVRSTAHVGLNILSKKEISKGVPEGGQVRQSIRSEVNAGEVTGDSSLIDEEDDDDDEDENAPEDYEGRATRRARGISVYLTCFAGADSIYFIIRLVVFLRVDIFHDAYRNTNGTKDESGYYYCDLVDLETQCAWIFSFSWACYFAANACLIMSIIWLSLKLCYAYAVFKTTSLIIQFLGIVFFGFYCLSQKFYVDTAVFFIFHLPLQIFGTKRTRNFGVMLKYAEIEKTRQRLINSTVGLPLEEEPSPAASVSMSPKRSMLANVAMSRRKSYAVVTTSE